MFGMSDMKRIVFIGMACVSLFGTGCSESEEMGKICNQNAKKCVDGVVFRCAGGSWSETKQKCDLEAKTCVGGLLKCSGDKLQTCKQGKWVTSEDCEESGASCNPESVSCIACSGNETGCFARKVKRCVNGVWEVVETCSGETPYCNSETASCQACEEGEVACASKDLRKCEHGEWQILQTCEDGICDQELGACRLCNDGEKQCDGNVLQVCKSGKWEEVENCAEKSLQCDAGHLDCRDMSCETGAMKCEKDGDKAYFYTCPEGLWVKQKNCRFGTCANNKRQCSEATCEIGDTKCDGNELLECDGYAYVRKETCDIKCTSSASEPHPYCAECIFRTSMCKDGALYWCNASDVWEKKKDCVSGSCLDSTKCPEDSCHYLDQKCENSKQSACVLENDVATWTTGVVCGLGCYDDKVCAECPSGEKKCWDDRVVECRNNEWHEVKTCGAGLCVNGVCRICSEGDWKCDIATATGMVCKNNQWVRNKCSSGYCEDAYACLDIECALQDSLHCVENTELRCSIDHKWVYKRRCTCVNGSCID